MIPGARFPTPAFFDASIEVILAASSDANGLDFPTLFSAPDWSGDTKKRIILPAGLTRGITDPTKYLFRTGTGRGGELELIIDGTLEGAGAAASSAAGNTGGGVLNVQQSGVKLLGSGAMKAGGGSGGKGGAGSNLTVQGPYWVPEYTYRFISNNPGAYWAGGWVSAPYSAPWTGFWYGGWYYERVADMGVDSNDFHNWSVKRSQTASTIGGNGARGQGHNQTAQTGATGGTNAGKGGDGGAFGVNGQAGANGNAGSGLAGGLAGIVINGAANLSDLFSGSKLGRII